MNDDISNKFKYRWSFIRNLKKMEISNDAGAAAEENVTVAALAASAAIAAAGRSVPEAETAGRSVLPEVEIEAPAAAGGSDSSCSEDENSSDGDESAEDESEQDTAAAGKKCKVPSREQMLQMEAEQIEVGYGVRYGKKNRP